MELENIKDGGVLSPQSRRSYEQNNDAKEQNLMDTVSKHTRRATRLKSIENKIEVVPLKDSSKKILDMPQTKTPSTSTKLEMGTPRRSARKSIRPPLDYEEIIEKTLLRSATKDTALNGVDCNDDAQSTQKWTPAEVGRNSCKRHRKSKRLTYKKTNDEKENRDKENEQDKNTTIPSVEDEAVNPNSIVPIVTTSVEIQSIDKSPKSSVAMPAVVTSKTTNIRSFEDEPVNAEAIVPIVTPVEIQSIDESPKSTEAIPAVVTDKNTNIPSVEDEVINPKSIVPIVTSGEIQSIDKSLKSSVAMSSIVTDAEMESLGLQPLDVIELISDHDDDEEMPSLILLEDNELLSPAALKENVLNTTFDADEKQSESKITNQADDCMNAELTKVILNTTFDADEQATVKKNNIVFVDEDMPKLCVSPEKNESAAKNAMAIKVVVTSDKDLNTTILKWNSKTQKQNTPRDKSSTGFRFPTPFKKKANYNFSSSSTTAEPVGTLIVKKAEKNNLNASCSIIRRRSKSISELNDTKLKSVSFYSPIEVAHTNDIDKRWAKFNDNHVTKRRKRSISLDDNRVKLSKIPKPVAIETVKIITPRKVQIRTKLPDFAAIHKKQFAQMENLVQHVERKAERAKALTNSATKIINGSSQKSSAKKTQLLDNPIGDYSRPRALKKIDLGDALTRPTPVNHIDLPKPQPVQKKTATQSNLPVRAPLKITNSLPVVIPKQPFNLSTNVVKGFSTSIAPVGIKKIEPNTNKVNDRRQRHVEMFKGRSATRLANNENKGDFIRGVRLNRRFELQMQHRRHINDN